MKVLSTLFVMVLSLTTHAQSLCKDLFKLSSTSYYKESFHEVRQLSNMASALINQIRDNPESLDHSTLEKKVKNLEFLAEEYFRASKMHYETTDSVLSFSIVKNEKIFNFEVKYKLYKLQGSKDGDEVARMVLAAHELSKKSDGKLKIILDVLQLISRPKSLGRFSGSDNKILIGPQSLSYEVLNLSKTLRHEVQHFIENEKIKAGKMSLARIKLFEPSRSLTAKGYEDYLQMDELETYIRDLRSSLRKGSLHSRDLRLFDALDKNNEKMNNILNVRSKTVEEVIVLIKNILNDSETMLDRLEIAVNNKTHTSISESLDGSLVVEYYFMAPPYTNALVMLDGLMTYKDLKNYEKVNASLYEVITWSKIRLQQIKKEFLELTQN
ncbi:MAG: hypothetical protein ACK41T_11215 [Pseudobdellovibrio sp.]